MSNIAPTSPLSPAHAEVTVAQARDRQTARPATPFREFLAGGASALVAGAQTTAGLIGGPVLAAAVRGATIGATGGNTGGTLAATLPGAAGRGVVAGAGGALSGAADRGDMADMHAMQRESQAFNMQLLELQEEVQQENRRFTTLSNVLRAKHDTAKSAVGNIRS